MGSTEAGVRTESGYLLEEMEKARGVESSFLPMGRELGGEVSSGQTETKVQSSYLLPDLGRAATTKTESVFQLAELNSLGDSPRAEAAEGEERAGASAGGSVFALGELNSAALLPQSAQAPGSVFCLPAPSPDLLSAFLLPSILA